MRGVHSLASVQRSARGIQSARRLAALLALILATSSLLAISPRTIAASRTGAPTIPARSAQPAQPRPNPGSNVRAEQLPHATTAISSGVPGSLPFTNPINLPLNNPSVIDMAMGDLNGDGALDFVFANFDGASQVYLNDGHGGFSAPHELRERVGGNTSSVALADLNGDGALDIVLGKNSFSAMGIPPPAPPSQVYLNDGHGGFGVSYDLAKHAVAPMNMAVGDVDGDGAFDLVMVDGVAVGQVYRNDKHGNFALMSSFPITFTAGFDNQSIALGDLNGDGKLDLAFAGATSMVYENNGHGGFALAASLPITATESIALGDLNGDGKLDLVFTGATNQVYLNMGNNQFAPSCVLDSSGSHGGKVVIGDLNGDGKLDLLANGGQAASVYLNDGQGGCSAPIALPGSAGYWNNIMVGDLNGDGALDLVLGGTLLYLNNGSEVLSSQNPLSTAHEYTDATAIGDMDGDGRPDIVVANDNFTQVYHNQGNGKFDVPRALGTTVDGKTTGLAIGDLDGNGTLDIVLGRFSAASQIYMNNGNSDFELLSELPLSDNTSSVAIGDLNGDGKLDLIFAGDKSQIYLNMGTGNLRYRPARPSARAPQASRSAI